MIREINLYAQEMHIFPYENVNRGEDIVIWGAGRICYEYLSQLYMNNYCHIKYIVDKNSQNIKCLGDIPVSSPNLFDACNLKVVVAIQNEVFFKEVEDFLKEKGYSDDRIVWSINSVPIIHDECNMHSISKRLYCSRADFISLYGMTYYNKLVKIRSLLNVSRPNVDLVRVGSGNDGGYVMADCFIDGGIAYSFGIGNDVSWDSDMARRGYDIYMYDHTIEKLPYEDVKFHFNKKGILNSVETNEYLDTLENYVLTNNHSDQKDMVLKMDVEGAEYGFMDNVDINTLKQFDQIMFEMHSLNEKNNLDNVIRFLNKVAMTHQLINVHVNNYSDVLYVDELVFPDTIEVTYLNKINYQFEYGNLSDQCDLNSPNWVKIPDVTL